MINIQSRAYRGKEDYARVGELLSESYAISGKMHNWGIDCWDFFRYNGKVFEEIANSRAWEKDVRLWETDAGKLVAAVIFDEGEAYPQVHPQQRHLEGEMLDWAERRHEAARPAEADSWPLSFFVYEYDQERQALLSSRGYENLGHDSYMRRRSFEEPLPQASLPEGYSMRHIDGEDQEDLGKRAAVVNGAYDISRHTAQTIATLQKAPAYRPELDLVAVAPDGTFAAYAVVWFDEANQVCMFGPVGTHRAYWQRGLAKALMCEGLRRSKALGVTLAYVDCSLDEAANRLYESVGFTDHERVYHWQKGF